MARILVVEDEGDLREILREMLTRAHHDVLVASGAREALAAWDAHRPDLVISDLLLPDESGLNLILALSRDHGARVIAMSGAAFAGPLDLVEAAEQFGAWRTLRKPIRRQELLTTVAEALAGIGR